MKLFRISFWVIAIILLISFYSVWLTQFDFLSEEFLLVFGTTLIPVFISLGKIFDKGFIKWICQILVLGGIVLSIIGSIGISGFGVASWPVSAIAITNISFSTLFVIDGRD